MVQLVETRQTQNLLPIKVHIVSSNLTWGTNCSDHIMVQYTRFSFLSWWVRLPLRVLFIYFDITRRAIVLVNRITVNAVFMFLLFLS